MRILHFSDPHFFLNIKDIPLSKWFGKRAIGAFNLFRGRGKRFNEAHYKIEALRRFKESQNIDLTLCTGDVSALGLDFELRDASKTLSKLVKSPENFIIIPGNHDLYCFDTIKSNHFQKFFSQYMKSDIPQYCVDDIYPIVRLFDNSFAVIALNSAKPNPLPWRSDGYIPDTQIEALKDILKDSRVKDRWIFVMTHYASRRADGTPDTPHHGLKNANEFLEACRPIRKGAILNGHIHKTYRINLAKEGLDIDEFCAGSVTMDKREGFWLFEIEKEQMKAYQGGYDSNKGEFYLINSQ